MKILPDWTQWGHCKTCHQTQGNPCKFWKFNRLRPHKNRQTYEEYCKKYARILTEHFGREVTPAEVDHYLPGGSI